MWIPRFWNRMKLTCFTFYVLRFCFSLHVLRFTFYSDNPPMLHYFKFRQDLFDPQPARDVYVKRSSGKGWPEHCPPIRAANGFGFDLLANYSIEFRQTRTGWKVEPDVVIESDFDWSGSDEAEGRPLTQQFAWFWEK